MLIIWFLLTAINVFTWLVVYSNYQELSDITRLEDMAKLKMSTLSSLNASRSFSHHSLDSANPYGRYGGTGVGSGTGSLQPSPQIYHHSMVTNQPLTIHESHQNIATGSRPSAVHHQQSTALPTTPRSHHSSQNSLHATYLQMYSNTLSQRSRQSSAASLSINSMANAFPMQSYTSSSNNQPQSLSFQQQHHSSNQQPTSNVLNTNNNQQSRLNNSNVNYGSAAFTSYPNRHNNTPM